jgi:hypothetical protein
MGQKNIFKIVVGKMGQTKILVHPATANINKTIKRRMIRLPNNGKDLGFEAKLMQYWEMRNFP